MPPSPEQRARQDIDEALEESGWIVQDRAAMNLSAGRGVAIREFKRASGPGFADYLRSALAQIEDILGDLERRAGGS